MVRGVIVGVLAFAAAFAAERVIAGMKSDLTRYNRMRMMSGEEPLANEVLSTIGSLITGSVQKNGLTSLVTSLTNDVVRYAKIRGM
jgi:hypothetical protein